MRKHLKTVAALAVAFTASMAFAKTVEKSVEYSINDKKYEGVMIYDDAKKAQPGVLVVHDWMGLSDKTKEKARELAKLGYVAFAVDIYGQGVRPANTDEAGKMATKYKSDRPLFRKHLWAGYKALVDQKVADENKIAAIGYCFGGTGVIEMARSDNKLRGVVSFHGGLDSPTPRPAKINAPMLVLHGADDPYVPAKDLSAFEDEMKQLKAKYRLVKYPGAVHGFTDKYAGTDNSKGYAYNAQADQQSWVAMQSFLKESL